MDVMKTYLYLVADTQELIEIENPPPDAAEPLLLTIEGHDLPFTIYYIGEV